MATFGGKTLKMKTKLYIFAVILSISLLLPEALPFSASAETSPRVSVEYCNLTFEDETYVKYAVEFSGIPDGSLTRSNTGMLYWTEPQRIYTVDSAEYSSEIIGYTFIAGEKYYTFSYDRLTAKQMTDYVYSVAYAVIDGVCYYSEPVKYSILTYAYDKLGYTGTKSDSTEYRELLRDLLDYGADAQMRFGYNTDRLANDRYREVVVESGRLPDGTDRGLYLTGEVLRVTGGDGERVTEITVGDESVRVNALTGEQHAYHSCDLERTLISETAPTCTADGFYSYACGICGKKAPSVKASDLSPTDPYYSPDRHDAHGHSFTCSTHIPATCTEDGYDVYECENGCFVIEEVSLDSEGDPLYPAIGHDLHRTVVLPICDPSASNNSGCSGLVSENCGRCGYRSRVERIEFDYNDPTHHPGAYLLRIISESDGNSPRLTEWACPTCSNIFIAETASSLSP